MKKIEIFKSISANQTNAAADISKINEFSKATLKPEDVYTFSVVLCDNEVDRDGERFTNESLESLALLFVGKTGISDHRWSADRQVARLYRVVVDTTDKTNSLGEPLKVLRGSAYMLRTESTTPMVEAIEGGILKEVSVGCSVGACNCSICGKALNWDWRTGLDQCESGHIKGQEYDGKLCVGDLVDPKDAYEFSFVAVPSQRGAGVTKSYKDMPKTELEARKQILADENKKFIESFKKKAAPSVKTGYTPPPAARVTDPIELKGLFYKAVLLNDKAAMRKAYEGLGAIPDNTADLGYGENLLPTTMSNELITGPLS